MQRKSDYMRIEDEIFHKCKIDTQKLIAYGFQYAHDVYTYQQNILNDSFQVTITITSDMKINGEIYDLAFQELYTNYRIDTQIGEFVAKVRHAYRDILENIKEKCTTSQYFRQPQSNRLAKMIEEAYGDLPEFLWEKTPNTAVFRNPKNKKWYAAILAIPKNKISMGDEQVDVLNVKLDKNKIEQLLQQQGYYKAYHMNKTYWISIILDDTLDDERIMTLIKESHQFTEKKRS